MTEKKEYTIDDTDIEILKLLSQDSTQSHRKISEILDKSPVTINKHVQDLEKSEIIKNHTITIDYEKLGYDIIALIEVTIDKGKMKSVEEEVAADSNVFAVYDLTGDYDAVILARFKSRNDLNTFVKNLNSREFIIRTNTHLVLNVIKEGTDFAELMKKEVEVK